MASRFELKIVTPAGLVYSGEAEMLTVHTSEGSLGILRGHADYLAGITEGPVELKVDGTRRRGRAKNGFVRILPDITTLVAAEFEWSEDSE